MPSIKKFTPRNYQTEITQTAVDNNTLVVLPTGTGKTKIAILTAIERLNQHSSNILVISPTKPLSAQIQKEFIESTDIPEDQILLLTGATSPKKRQELWESAVVVVATPQTIQKDLEAERISLSPTSLLVIDECHRSRMNFANTKVAETYIQQSKFPRILALTASPGGSKQKIDEIRENLHIDSIEIRTEEDISEFIQKKEIKYLEVSLPANFKALHHLIKTPYKNKLKELKKLGFNKPVSVINKRDLLMLQQRFRKQLNQKNPTSYYGISLTALLIKLDYAAELLETQGLIPLQDFWTKLSTDETKAAKNILNFSEIQKALALTQDLIEKNVQHPKIYMLKGIIKKELEKNPKTKFIIFANYRNTIDNLLTELNSLENVNATKLIGQKSGLTQKEQISTIKDFSENKFNILLCSQIGEEGIDVPGGAEIAVFYDFVPSEIRGIQRRGRVGRTKAGKIISLLTQDTREMGYFWASKRKENLMKNTLKNLQEKETQTTL
jgi:Fanconi anemia group M protein